MMSFTRWHKMGLCAALMGVAAWCVLWFGSDALPQRHFDVLKVPAIAVFVGAIAVGIYCWVRIMKVVVDKFSRR
jgi:hypothetical protein